MIHAVAIRFFSKESKICFASFKSVLKCQNSLSHESSVCTLGAPWQTERFLESIQRAAGSRFSFARRHTRSDRWRLWSVETGRYIRNVCGCSGPTSRTEVDVLLLSGMVTVMLYPEQPDTMALPNCDKTYDSSGSAE
ncbi:MAG: hypothetical protein Q9217_002155 [Psora testacea]